MNIKYFILKTMFSLKICLEWNFKKPGCHINLYTPLIIRLNFTKKVKLVQAEAFQELAAINRLSKFCLFFPYYLDKILACIPVCHF